ncbi:MAG: MGMT family protein [Methanolinea sp.]|nr:MGMT family protein [Methanolinea sp.]
MEMRQGSCRLGFWHVHVTWEGNVVHGTRFSPFPLEGAVPLPIRRYCAGLPEDLTVLGSIALGEEYPFSEVYRLVRGIPYGETATYGELGEILQVSPRLVGLAMKRNPTPLVIPCHRVVSRNGIGGFSPGPEIKEYLLAMEKRGRKK